MKIKICGVTGVADARLCADEGADYVGLIFADSSPRKVTVAAARRVVRALPRTVRPVAVFLDQPLDRARDILQAAGIGIAQLHGAEDPAYARAVGVPAIKVFDRFSKQDMARLRGYDVFAYLMDLPKGPSSGRKTVDVDFAIRAKSFGRVILSGRLGPSNVGDLVRRVRPFAVDACSCTERAPGRKDRGRVRSFIEAVRHAAAAV
jgi:phosphoribosylanthranilate isomerase